jgi:hypothetical protein
MISAEHNNHLALAPIGREMYPEFSEAPMFSALCIGCLAVFILGTAIRFGLLAGLLARLGLLPESWRRWMFDAKSPNSTR